MQETHPNQSAGIPVIPPPGRPRRAPGKWLIAAVIVLIVGIASVLAINNQSKQGADALPAGQVQITNGGFVPETIKVKQGQSVTWTNVDASLHQVAADPYPTHSKLPALFSQESLAQNETYTFTFDKAGTYTYHDPLHAKIFHGTVIVE